ncbi:MAG: DUF1214 domain-containing protein [Pseudomonadota bacterium]
MIKRAAIYIFGAILGIALGIASALYMAGLWPGMKPLDFGDVEINGWRSDFALGSEAADPYTRARVARHGLLALAKSEAVYFTRTTDDEGKPLSEDCTYRLTVGKLPAGWWSVTLYNGESHLPDNTDEALSVNATQAEGDSASGGGFVATVSAQRPEQGAWISSRKAGNFDLTLRLYMPDQALLDNPQGTLKTPSVKRVACKGDTP